jgi:hypothetical protein
LGRVGLGRLIGRASRPAKQELELPRSISKPRAEALTVAPEARQRRREPYAAILYRPTPGLAFRHRPSI